MGQVAAFSTAPPVIFLPCQPLGILPTQPAVELSNASPFPEGFAVEWFYRRPASADFCRFAWVIVVLRGIRGFRGASLYWCGFR
jgi:hypothetical protein